MSFLVDSFADLLNLGYFRVGGVVGSSKECLSFFAVIDAYHGPCQVVVNRGCLAGVPDSADDGVCFVLGLWIRFMANLSFRGVNALAGTDPGEPTSFSRAGFRCRRISDSEGYPLTIRSTS